MMNASQTQMLNHDLITKQVLSQETPEIPSNRTIRKEGGTLEQKTQFAFLLLNVMFNCVPI